MKKNKKQQNKKPKIIKITPEQLVQLTEAIRASNLDPELGDMIIDNISGNRWLVSALEKGQLSIQKLRKLFNITTESFENRRKQRHKSPGTNNPAEDAQSNDVVNTTSHSPETNKKKKGHGRLRADAYQGATVIDIDLPDLKSGGSCPEDYCDGRLYEMSDPGVFIQITGAPTAQATRYNLQKLRCSICDIIFTGLCQMGLKMSNIRFH